MDAKQIYLSPDLAERLAAIDIGSNSVRLMVAEPLRGEITAFSTKNARPRAWVARSAPTAYWTRRPSTSP